MAIAEEYKVSRLQRIVLASRCPSCHKEALDIKLSAVSCHNCGDHFRIKAYTVDFVDNKDSYRHDDSITRRSLEIWGESLHSDTIRNFPSGWHHSNFHRMFPDRFLDGNVILEIGCGAGIDSVLTARQFPEKTYYALDIGENVATISERDKELRNLHYMRGDCLNLPVRDSYFDSILSYGVFHHTDNLLRCMQEAFRALKSNGSIYVYLYKNHEDNPLKYFGVILERILVSITSKVSIKTGKLICLLISPIMLLLFSGPAQLMKRFKRLERIGNSFPLHGGPRQVRYSPIYKTGYFLQLIIDSQKRIFQRSLWKLGFQVFKS